MIERGEREVEAEVPAPDVEVARQPPDRHAEHHQQAEAGDDETDQDERLAHTVDTARSPFVTCCITSVSLGVEVGVSNQLDAGEEVPDFVRRRLRRIGSMRRVALDRLRELLAQRAGSALAGSVAPISVRHFLIASGASSTSTIAGPDDMNAVRLPKNGRSRCTA